MSTLLRIMHFPCFHYYIVITLYYNITRYYTLPAGQLVDAARPAAAASGPGPKSAARGVET